LINELNVKPVLEKINWRAGFSINKWNFIGNAHPNPSRREGLGASREEFSNNEKEFSINALFESGVEVTRTKLDQRGG